MAPFIPEMISARHPIVDERSLRDRLFFYFGMMSAIIEQIEGKSTNIVLRDEGVEGTEGRSEISAESVSDRSDNVSSRRNQDGLILRLIFRRLLFIVLVGVLLAFGLLIKDLHGHSGDLFQI
jgi:hypothetical protein